MHYYGPQEAKTELIKRRQDFALKEKVLAFIDELPQDFPQVPFCATTPYIASPNRWNLQFVEETRKMELPALWLEYLQDTLTCRNVDKVDLWRIRLFHGYGRNGGVKLDKINVVKNPSFWEAKRICEVTTHWGESLIAMHRRLLSSATEGASHRMVDLSRWYGQKGGRAARYYPYLLALFVWHGILFEDFSSQEIPGLEDFTENTVIPSWQKVVNAMGKAPLIVRLPWEPSLNWYPGKLKELIPL